MLKLHDLKSLDWESLPQNGPEWLEAIRSAKQGVEKLMGNLMTPQEVFDAIFDKDAKAEMAEQE